MCRKFVVIDIRLTFQQRIQAVFDNAHAGLEAKEEIICAIYEQTYDVRADLNDALIMFCQVSSRAFYY